MLDPLLTAYPLLDDADGADILPLGSYVDELSHDQRLEPVPKGPISRSGTPHRATGRITPMTEMPPVGPSVPTGCANAGRPFHQVGKRAVSSNKGDMG